MMALEASSEGEPVIDFTKGQGAESKHGAFEPGEPVTEEDLEKQERNFGLPRLSRIRKAGIALLGTAAAVGGTLGFLTRPKTGEGVDISYVPAGAERVIDVPPGTEGTTIPGTNIPKPTIGPIETQTPTATSGLTETPSSAETITANATETMTSAEDPIFGRYDRLASKIERAEISAEDKVKYLAEVEKYKDVERVQARFLEAYHSAVGPDGKTPELLYYLEQKWPAMPDFSAEDQIFFIRNGSKLEGFIRPKIEDLAANFSKRAADEIFLAIDQKMANVGYEPGRLYFGVEFSMSDYRFLAHPELVPKTEVDYSNLSAEQIAKMKELQTKLAPLIGNFRMMQNFHG